MIRAYVSHTSNRVEIPVPYQKFFRTLEQTFLLQGHLVE